MMTDEELVEYALRLEYECKCVGPHVCHGCIINALRAEVKRLREEARQRRNEVVERDR